MTAQALSPTVISAIESDPHQTPVRFSVSVPFDTPDEFYDSGVFGFWIDALDSRGNSVLPAGARLENTPFSGWPSNSRVVWDPSHPEVMVLSYDLVNADGSMVTPTQLGCDRKAITFTFGMSTTDLNADFDFGWSAGLWRTKVDEQDTFHGQGGIWLGWHSSTYRSVSPQMDYPVIVDVLDANGSSVTSVTRGEEITLVVQNGLDVDESEISVGGYIVHDIYDSGPGGQPDQTYYTFEVPWASFTGSWCAFYRRNGATHRSDPSLIGLVTPGYDFRMLTIK